MAWHQEWHETAASTATIRSRQLRKAGFTVSVGSMGMQVTPVGLVKLTLLTVHDHDRELPEPPQNGQPVDFR